MMHPRSFDKEIDIHLQLSPRRITRFIVFVVLLFAILNVAGHFYISFVVGDENRFLSLFRMFNLDIENNIPTAFSALIFLLCSFLLGLIGIAKKDSYDRFAYCWLSLSIIFVFLALDELLQIHEGVNRHLNPMIGTERANYWDVFSSSIAIMVGVLYLRFYLHLPRKIKKLFLLAFLFVVTGGVGLELLSLKFFEDLHNKKTFGSQLVITVEESLEVIGLAIFIRALFEYIGSFTQEICIRITGFEASQHAKH